MSASFSVKSHLVPLVASTSIFDQQFVTVTLFNSQTAYMLPVCPQHFVAIRRCQYCGWRGVSEVAGAVGFPHYLQVKIFCKVSCVSSLPRSQCTSLFPPGVSESLWRQVRWYVTSTSTHCVNSHVLVVYWMLESQQTPVVFTTGCTFWPHSHANSVCH